MDFELNEDQLAFQRSAREFAAGRDGTACGQMGWKRRTSR